MRSTTILDHLDEHVNSQFLVKPQSWGRKHPRHGAVDAAIYPNTLRSAVGMMAIPA